MNPALAVQKAIYDVLIANNAITTELGGQHVYDDALKGVRPPYLLFGTIESDDWSTGTEAGQEHLIELVAWSQKEGRKQAQLLVDLAVDALTDLGGVHDGHRLVNLTHETTVSHPADKKGYHRSVMTLRAVTEPDLP